MAFRQHFITVGNESAAEDVVKVRVRVNLMHGAQLFLFDIGRDGLLVGGIIAPQSMMTASRVSSLTM